MSDAPEVTAEPMTTAELRAELAALAFKEPEHRTKTLVGFRPGNDVASLRRAQWDAGGGFDSDHEPFPLVRRLRGPGRGPK